MSKAKFVPPRRKWKNRRVICVAANKRDAANSAVAAFGWGPDFFSIPLYNPADKKIKEYAAEVVLTDEMLVQLATLHPSTLKPADIETPNTTANGKAKLKEIATKRGVETNIAV